MLPDHGRGAARRATHGTGRAPVASVPGPVPEGEVKPVPLSAGVARLSNGPMLAAIISYLLALPASRQRLRLRRPCPDGACRLGRVTGVAAAAAPVPQLARRPGT